MRVPRNVEAQRTWLAFLIVKLSARNYIQQLVAQ
jgi:hypothetical protein